MNFVQSIIYEYFQIIIIAIILLFCHASLTSDQNRLQIRSQDQHDKKHKASQLC